ncbi:hypothetical protein GOBAR_DD30369 [Gossypium barbadense]|nr:hypothetical protein GOBAR_DD30369 [Gossypium barbadense]
MPYCGRGDPNVQTRRHIRPLRSSDNIHRPPNPDDSHVNPHLTVIVRDLARGPARALLVAENNMPSDSDPSSSLRPIPRTCCTYGGITVDWPLMRQISDNIHRPPNPDDSHVNPHLTVIVRDLARGPARALLVAENNMPSDSDPSSSLRPIPQLAARTGGLQSTGL